MVKIIKIIFVCAYICIQGWFPLVVAFEYFARGMGIPFVSLGILMGFAILVMNLRDAQGELLFQESRGKKVGWMTFSASDF